MTALLQRYLGCWDVGTGEEFGVQVACTLHAIFARQIAIGVVWHSGLATPLKSKSWEDGKGGPSHTHTHTSWPHA